MRHSIPGKLVQLERLLVDVDLGAMSVSPTIVELKASKEVIGNLIMLPNMYRDRDEVKAMKVKVVCMGRETSISK